MQVDGGPPEGRWTSAAPTTQPDSLMSAALLLRLPRGPRSSIRPRCHRKACRAPLRVVLQPTTCPRSLRATAALMRPPGSVPRSRIRPACHRNACSRPVLVELEPTTWPRSLIALAQVDDPPSVLKRVTFRSWRTNAWQGKGTPLRLLFTTTCPSSLIPTGQLTRSPRAQLTVVAAGASPSLKAGAERLTRA